MGLFSRNNIGKTNYFPCGGPLNRKPDMADRLEILFTDVETKGKKQGYVRAAAEYEKAFHAIECEYKYTKYLIHSSRNMHERQSNLLIQKLKSLEQQKYDLEKQLEQKTQNVSKKYNIPAHKVRSLLTGSRGMTSSETSDIFELIYTLKKIKLQEAEQRGYQEAKELYEVKIAGLRNDLEALKKKGDAEIQELIDMSNDILEAIADEQMKIAELNLLI